MSETGPGGTPAQDAAQEVLTAADAARALLATEALAEQLEKTARAARELRVTVRWGKKVIIALAASFAVDILVTAGLGWNTYRQDQVQNSSHADQISACQQANVARRQDAAIWDTFLSDIAPPAAQTPKVKALLAGIDKRIAIKDTPKNCTATYRTAP